MKKTIVFMAILLLMNYSFAGYEVGDVLEDFNFQDTNLENGNVVTYNRNLTDLTANQKKVLFINYFFPG